MLKKTIAVLLLVTNGLYAQLNSSQRKEIVHNIGQLLMENYVYPDTARKMSNTILQKWKKGDYDRIEDPVVFSDRLTNDLYSVYHDGHLLVQYNPALADEIINPPQNNVSDDNNIQRISEVNFGFKKVEILNGNIGYISMTRFWADREHGLATIKATLQFVAHTNAIIFDLRECGGGSQETVTMIMGFFFRNSTHVETFYDRSNDQKTEYWTMPDSSFTSLNNIPLYILTSNKTFSASEMFAYDMQALKRATIIGETTGGGAHGTFARSPGKGFVLYIPYWLGINPVTHTNWEGVGVQPDIDVPVDEALEVAEMKVFNTMLSNAADSNELFRLNWQMDLLKAINHPVHIDSSTLQKYAGTYGERVFTFENGKLFYQRTGRPKFELEPMTPTIMKGKGNNYFKIEFIADEKGWVDLVKAYYEDNRIEFSKRTN